MYESARETWREWGRSIAMADVTPPAWLAADVAVVWLAMALPLARLLARRGTALDAAARGRPACAACGHACVPAAWRGLLARPAGRRRGAVRLTWSALRPRREWRGRTY